MSTTSNYDDFLLPANKLDAAKESYKSQPELDIKFDFSEMGVVAFKVG